MTDLICVGSIAGAYGVRGELRIKSFCADPEAIQDYSPLVSEDGTQDFALALIGRIKSGFSARIVGVDTKEQADALKGTQLFARRDQLPALPDDEYYYSDLIGLSVRDTGGAVIGTVASVDNHGADDLLEVRLATGGETALIPFTKSIVPTVDMEKRLLVIDPPEGLLPQ